MAPVSKPQPLRLKADFNGLFGRVLCLSHSDFSEDEHGNRVALCAGMHVTAFEFNMEGDVRDDLVASGIVEPSPDWLRCRGSRWILAIDEDGMRYESEIAQGAKP